MKLGSSGDSFHSTLNIEVGGSKKILFIHFKQNQQNCEFILVLTPRVAHIMAFSQLFFIFTIFFCVHKLVFMLNGVVISYDATGDPALLLY